MLDRYDENLILGYVEDELDAADRAAFEQQLAADDQLRATVEAMISDRQMLRDVPAVEAPSHLMNDVTAALERHMLTAMADDAAASASPVVYRFPQWARWASAMAAMVLIAAGLTWKLDPFNWSKPVDHSRDLAIGTKAIKGNPAEPDPAKLGSVENKNQGNNSPLAAGPSDLSVKDSAGFADASGQAGGAVAPGQAIAGKAAVGDTLANSAASQPNAVSTDKGTAALALAMQSANQFDALQVRQYKSVEQQATQQRVARGGGGAPDAELSVAPAQLQFQVQVASAQRDSTREALLGWADRNGVMEVSALGGASQARRTNAMKKLGEDGGARSLRLEKDADAAGAKSPAAGEALPDPNAGDASPAGNLAQPEPAAERPLAEPRDDAKTDGVADPAAPLPTATAPQEPENDNHPKYLDREELAKAGRNDLSGSIGREAELRGQFAEADREAPGDELVLLVPEDRLDGLVSLLEAKTGQSLVIINEQGATMLVSPQVANERARRLNEAASARLGAAAFGAGANSVVDTRADDELPKPSVDAPAESKAMKDEAKANLADAAPANPDADHTPPSKNALSEERKEAAPLPPATPAPGIERPKTNAELYKGTETGDLKRAASNAPISDDAADKVEDAPGAIAGRNRDARIETPADAKNSELGAKAEKPAAPARQVIVRIVIREDVAKEKK